MSEFVKIGDVASVLNSLEKSSTPKFGSLINRGEIKNKNTIFPTIIGLVLIGIVSYKLHKHYEKNRKEEVPKDI